MLRAGTGGTQSFVTGESHSQESLAGFGTVLGARHGLAPRYLLSSSTCTPMEWNSLWLRLSVSESEMASTCRGQRENEQEGSPTPRASCAAPGGEGCTLG